ncbi:MAG: hypothetical protein ACOWWM_18255 [Desulfobacterales bacterium]
MTAFHMFFIRAVLGLVFAVIITKVFRGVIDPVYVTGLAIILVGLAYLMEYLRKRRKP